MSFHRNLCVNLTTSFPHTPMVALEKRKVLSHFEPSSREIKTVPTGRWAEQSFM